MLRIRKEYRTGLVTFLVAGIAAVFGEHLLKPRIKAKIRA